MDPAHNLHDLLEISLNERPKRVIEGLRVRESDIAAQAAGRIKELRRELKGSYHHLQTLNIERFIDIFRYAPGMEEHASLMVLERALSESRADTVVIDTPPTALTVKTLALPSVSLKWIEQLGAMRREILAKKLSVARIRRQDQSKLREDRVLYRLVQMEERYRLLRSGLSDAERTHIHIVMNDDPLSLAESTQIQRQLVDLGLSAADIWVNRSSDLGCSDEIREAFPGQQIRILPQLAHPPVGITALRAMLAEIEACGEELPSE